MTTEEYIARLMRALTGFDKEEAENAVQYYSELLQDSEDPEEQMQKLGSPEQLAQRIRQESIRPDARMGQQGSARQVPPPTNTSSNDAGRLILTICTFPLWIAAFIVLVSVFASFWIVYASLIMSAFASLIKGFSLMGTYVPYGLLMIAGAAALGGIDILLFRPLVLLSKGMINLTIEFARNLFAWNSKR